jgi:DNA polymerase III delta prime subunit
VEGLTRLLRGSDRRPVLILGPALVGKTALLHEYVFRTMAARKDPYRVHNNVWLLSPQRLISGMSFVGQWENRLLAILKEAKKRDHILYFDDFLGLYHAGRSSQSDLSVAHVLKPYVERREVRLVGEMTPDAFRVLRERDRGFADLFQVLPVREPTDEETLRILIAVTRHLEGQHRVRFRLDVLPTVRDLQRRYVRHLSFPGKAALFLRRLAVKHRGGWVARRTALVEFHEQSDLTLTLLDGKQKLDRAEVLASLHQDVVGQQETLETAADVIGIAKARLNDPGRPLASLLFLGPTGVGKTQCAKAIARYLFGEADKLLRFDMNEYLTQGSAARLAGTFDQPEGLLTAAVRRQPFAVVLLDEIEKAHSEVHDLLLQVLGEGRLTDALGRTADFSNVLIVLTSNLGVREAQQSLGFRAGDTHNAEVYLEAARRFFRPEFFNRIDRIIPFHRLGRAEIAEIARHLIHDVLHREGLVRRKCVLRLEESALERVTDQGFDPVMGARALKRGIERQLTQPVGARLARGVPETITVVNVYPLRDEITVGVQGLVEVERLPEEHRRLGEPEAVVHAVRAALRRIEERFAHLRPAGEITAASLGSEQLVYYVIQRQVRYLRGLARDLLDVLEESRRPNQGSPSLPVRGVARALAWRPYSTGPPRRNLLGELAAAQDIQLYLEELASQAVRFGEPDRLRLLELAEESALLEALAEASENPTGEAVVLYLWTANVAEQAWVDQLASLYHRRGFIRGVEDEAESSTLGNWWGLEQMWVGQPPSQDQDARRAFERLFEVQEVAPRGDAGPREQPWRALLVRGLGAARLTAGEVGSHLFCPERAGVVPVQVHAWPIADSGDPLALVQEKQRQRREWLAGLERGESGLEEDPLKMIPVVRLYNEGRHWIDLRTGLVDEDMPDVPLVTRATLPLPPEVREVGG